jgi:phenylalanyl-tRNA synthetase beta chain
MFFPGRAANIYYRAPPAKQSALSSVKHNLESALHLERLEDMKLGTLGILHPTVLEKFDIGYPCSSLEFTLEPFKKQTQKIWTNEE